MNMREAHDILHRASHGDPPEDGRELTRAMQVGAKVIYDVFLAKEDREREEVRLAEEALPAQAEALKMLDDEGR